MTRSSLRFADSMPDGLPPRPRFAETLGKALQVGAKRRGWIAYVPFRLGAALAVGGVASLSIPSGFWTDGKWDISTAVYGALLAFNGLLLAVGWGAFSKIYEIIGSDGFSVFLRRHGLLDIHIFFVEVVHLALAAALATATALVLLLAEIPLWIDRTGLALALGLSINSLVEAFRANGIMHDLIWEKAHAFHVEENVLSLRSHKEAT